MRSLFTGIYTHACMHIQVSDDELNKMLADVDEDGTGEIEFPEFCKLMGVDAKGAKAVRAEAKVY
jgi:Ca2+-binding EF-hand superfamily protein